MSEANGRSAFERLDLDGNGSPSRQELHRANEQFFRSPDAQALGNWLFGPLPPRI
ncbi:hypothetical protein [Microtetraspora malaysiensis]|uniref:hypothetical protein n=1 Tax=Microtetraspora malaysiensis TaxID=161358 RepID=UPI003D8E1320